jgi:biopolymer transport protein ExbD
MIPKLKAELTRQANLIRVIKKNTGQSDDFNGTITIQAHDKIPYRLLVKVLFTTGQSEFGDIRFMAYRRE